MTLMTMLTQKSKSNQIRSDLVNNEVRRILTQTYRWIYADLGLQF